MSWFRVDDSFTDHPKVKSIPRADRKAAIGLWTLAGSYVARQLTDGFLFVDDVVDLGCSQKDAAALVRSGLWHKHGHACARCPEVGPHQYLFHDFLIYNFSRARVLAERERAAERQRKAREKAASQHQSRRDSTVTTGVTSGEVPPVVTVPPSHPIPSPLVVTSIEGESPETLHAVPNEPPTKDEPRCSKHPNGNPTNEPCVGCGRVREHRDRAEAREAERRIAEIEFARNNCPDCEGTGKILDPETKLPTRKTCGHRNARRAAS